MPPKPAGIISHGVAVGFAAWSEEEDAALCAAYSSGGIYEAKKTLPHRSMCAIYHRVDRLGVERRRRWTRKDDAELRDLWELGELRLVAMAKRLRRTPKAVHQRAKLIGLPSGLPPGCEYMKAAKERTGYDYCTLRRICEFAGVPIRLSFAEPPRLGDHQRQHRWHYVDPFELDEAIAAWHETEPLTRAADRVGLCAATLARWLVAAGVTPPERGFRQHWRVKDADVERAVKLRAKTLGDRQWARVPRREEATT